MDCAETAIAAPGALCNIRDVGGLLLLDGGLLRSGVLYRSDAPHPGDAAPELRPWPPRTVIDLRSAGEGAFAHPLDGPSADLLRLPLFGDANPVQMAKDANAEPYDLTKMYLDIVRRAAPALVNVVAEIARRPAPVLVHCSAGKDRTGIAIALVLSAAGVAPEAIVADYRRTEDNMQAVAARLAIAWQGDSGAELLRVLTEQRPELLEAPAAAIEAVLGELHRGGGAERWLRRHGLASDQLASLRARLAG